MEITIKGQVHPLKFRYKATRKAMGLLGITDLKKMEEALGRIDYTNAHEIAHIALQCDGVDVTVDEVEDAIEDGGFPVRLMELFAKEIIGAGADEIKEVQDAVEGGN